MLFVTLASLLAFTDKPDVWPALMAVQRPEAPAGQAPRFETGFVNDGEMPEVHASTAIVDPRGRLRAYWFGGSREGASDVEIYTAALDPATETWGEQHSVIDRHAAIAGTDAYIRKLGNPVALTHSNAEVWLFYISVPIGGWAFSAVNLAKSFDGGVTFPEHKRLIGSPFLNRSTMVKSTPSRYEDGTIALPAHYELHEKHAKVLRLDSDGTVIGRQRINGDHEALQPQLLTDDDITVAIMRPGQYEDLGRRVLIATSADKGRSWSETRQIDIANPNSAVAAIRVPRGFIFVYTNREETRDQLSLGFAPVADADWQEIYLLEDEVDTYKHQFRFSYPWLVRLEGQYHLFYTYNGKWIKHTAFNDAWLNEQIEAAGG